MDWENIDYFPFGQHRTNSHSNLFNLFLQNFNMFFERETHVLEDI